MNRLVHCLAPFICMMLWPVFLTADVVETADGSRLTGRVVGIHDGMLKLETTYAGTIEIRMSEVTAFSTDSDVSVRLETGDVLVGPVRRRAEGEVEVSTAGGPVRARTAEVAAGWQPGQRDPAVIAREAELEDQLRRWTYEAGLDFSGREGNSDRMAASSRFRARLEGPTDRLEFYTIYSFAEESSVTTDHRAVGGLSFTSFFLDNLGWYVRQELEFNEPENIDLRSTSVAGLTYRWFNEPRHRLETRAGLSYRHESYSTGGTEDFPGMEFGLLNYWRFADWGEVTTDLAFLPSFDDFFGEFLVTHDSGVNIPLGSSDFWTLRLGLENRYNSSPDTGRDKLDTMYYVRLLLRWE